MPVRLLDRKGLDICIAVSSATNENTYTYSSRSSNFMRTNAMYSYVYRLVVCPSEEKAENMKIREG
jgi:hypothetical protein